MVTGEQVGLLDDPICGPGLASIRMGRWDEDIGAERENPWSNGKKGVFPKQREYLGINERGVVSGPITISSLDVIGECGFDGQGRVLCCNGCLPLALHRQPPTLCHLPFVPYSAVSIRSASPRANAWIRMRAGAVLLGCAAVGLSMSPSVWDLQARRPLPGSTIERAKRELRGG
jgi:hypothetical protein